MITYQQLPDSGAPSMACANPDCDEFAVLYSATRGDYFMADPTSVVSCGRCREPMSLAREHCVIEFLGDDTAPRRSTR